MYAQSQKRLESQNCFVGQETQGPKQDNQNQLRLPMSEGDEHSF